MKVPPINGRIVAMTQEEQFGEYKVKKVKFETDGKYPETFLIEFWNEKIDYLVDIKPNTKITIEANLKSTPSKDGKALFLKLNALDLRKFEKAPAAVANDGFEVF